MLSYQHGFHAGCFSDVLKHIVLTRILQYMTQKDKPLFYLETHAGRGRYDLRNNESLKTGEAHTGILHFLQSEKHLHPLFSPYLQCIDACNPHTTARYYPGSPSIAIQMLRPMDRMFCFELHPNEYQHLRQLPSQNKKLQTRQEDGIHALKAMLPPQERRGLVFIDPSFEKKSEYKSIPKAIAEAVHRFSTGTYCLWYPIVDREYHHQLVRGMQSIQPHNALRVEWTVGKASESRMNACGVWIIHPPYTLHDEMKSILETLCKIFAPDATYTLEIIEPTS